MTVNQPKPVNIKRMLWSIMAACGAMCFGVVLAVVLILNNADDQRAREDAQTLANRVGSCNQYNQQVQKTISNDRDLAESSARALVRASQQANPEEPSNNPLIENFIKDQGNSAEITSRKNNLFRDCSEAGIEAFLKLTSTVDCEADPNNPGFCMVKPPVTTTSTTTTLVEKR